MPASSIRYRLFGSIVCMWLIMATAQPARAQDPVADQRNAWVMYNDNHRFTDRWGLHTEGQWRRHDVYSIGSNRWCALGRYALRAL
ncbi:MAG: hypothetical protein IPI55_08330 [Flavobacteriales bacterium]|nr:hypothetical protein [Flavobacteriales bacterium]